MNPITLTAPDTHLRRVAQLSELNGAGPFAANADGLDLVIVKTATGLKAFEGRCPHQGALLGEGSMDGAVLVCRNHGWRFDAETGARRGGSECLVPCAVDVRGDEVWVDTAALERAQHERKRIARRTLSDLPGPRSFPIVGNLLQLEMRGLHRNLEAWVAEYGAVYRIRMGPNKVIVLAEPGLTEQVLRDRPEGYRRASNVEPVFHELGVDGVFSAEGEVWRPQRKLAMQALANRQLRSFYPALCSITKRLERRWRAKADAGVEVDLVEELKRFTVDITTMLVFGYDANTIEQGDDVLQRKLELVFPTLNRRLFALLPTWRWLRMPADRKVDRALAELRIWLNQLIAEARARLADDPKRAEQPENFLESMLSWREPDGTPVSDDIVIGNAITMLLAGEDTTAYTLAWAVHHLCDAPAAVQGLREETNALLNGDVVPADIETANRLMYAGAVANEAMRLRPVAPFLLLEANSDRVIGDIAIPRGTWVAVLTRPPALADHNFATPNEFRPERWHEHSQTTPHEKSAHMPFGSGPRICPGRSLALLEMKVLLAMLYRSFDVERIGAASDVTERFSFTMSPVGLKVRLTAR
jgi:cytochrome P450/nitrite reductase/ring-hydroxylating ferredoxin subunit